MNLRAFLYFLVLRILRGIKLGHYYNLYWRNYQQGNSARLTEKSLEQLLDHCKNHVPYYARVMRELGDSYHKDPMGYLQQMPVLTKDIIKANFQELQSGDLAARKWFYMTSGGSTGEPGRVIQDYEFSARAAATQLIFSRIVGRETGECEVYLWGSEREIAEGHENWKVRLANRLTNSIYFNAFRMTPARMVEIVDTLNRKKPKLIIAYAEAIAELAKYIEKEHITLQPQKAIITSAETLYPFMRELIERVFQCKVYNRYGSREIGNVAIERPGQAGLWVAPWANYVEILDGSGQRVADGEQGEIILTSLSNYAMPLLRYRIDDHGSLMPQNLKGAAESGQVFQEITGRSVNLLKTPGGMCHPGYLMILFFYKNWAKRYQIIQKSASHILFRVVLADQPAPQAELDEITSKTRQVFGEACIVEFDFVEDIAASPSGKFHWVINEMKD